MSGDSEQTYFSDGVTEDIITELSRFRALFVIARNSSFAFRDQQVGFHEIVRQLGVQYLLEGSVRRAGNRVRITAQLIEGATANHLWAERYDRELADIFAVQDEVVRTVVATVAGRVEAAGAGSAKRKPPESLVAYDHLLRGLEQLSLPGDEHNVVPARSTHSPQDEFNAWGTGGCTGLDSQQSCRCFGNFFPGSGVFASRVSGCP
jgi:adenylate cyclase